MAEPILLPTCLKEAVNEAGCDEAGRGCLAGPVVAAAVILPDGFSHYGLRDSKKLTPNQRMLLRRTIIDHALAWAIGECSPQEIDQINILNASILAMHRALDGLKMTPGHIVVDGNRFKPWRDVPHMTVVKGDDRLANIAAASILAKTHRDMLMLRAAGQYPGYGWESNMGYPTRAHRQAIARLGTTPLHRLTFKLT